MNISALSQASLCRAIEMVAITGWHRRPRECDAGCGRARPAWRRSGCRECCHRDDRPARSRRRRRCALVAGRSPTRRHRQAALAPSPQQTRGDVGGARRCRSRQAGSRQNAETLGDEEARRAALGRQTDTKRNLSLRTGLRPRPWPEHRTRTRRITVACHRRCPCVRLLVPTPAHVDRFRAELGR